MGLSQRLELDPDGDIELILQHSNSQNLQWTPIEALNHDQFGDTVAEKPVSQQEPYHEDSTTDIKVDFATDVSDNREYSLEPVSSGSIEENELRMLVSSRHLCLASSTFRNMLNGTWSEGTSNSGMIRQIRASEWDASAFLVVQDIMHGHHIFIPVSVDLEMLAKIAAIVDYYDCHDVMEPFVTPWIRELHSTLPQSYGRDCVLWMSISWVFLHGDMLQKMARLAVMGCQTSVSTMAQPVPDVLLRRVEEKRSEIQAQTLDKLYKLSEALHNEAKPCPSGCTEMLLGCLTRQMRSSGISTHRCLSEQSVI